MKDAKRKAQNRMTRSQISVGGKPSKQSRKVLGDLSNYHRSSSSKKKSKRRTSRKFHGSDSSETSRNGFQARSYMILYEAPPADSKPPSRVRKPLQESQNHVSLQFDPGVKYGKGVEACAGSGCPKGHHTASIPRGVHDIDEKHPRDPAYCHEYVKDVHSYWSSLQYKYPVSPNYMMKVQKSGLKPNTIDPKMRGILVEWLVDVAAEFELVTDTLYLAVTYIDRFLSLERVGKAELQLVGITCLFIAAKFEDQTFPKVSEAVDMTDRTYTPTQLTRMEGRILTALEFRLASATSKVFLRRLQRAANVTAQEKMLGNYISELALVSYDLVGCPGELLAAATMHLARLTLYAEDTANEPQEECKSRSPGIWNAELLHYSSFTENEVAAVVRKLHEIHCNTFARRSGSIFDKHAKRIYWKISKKIEPYRGIHLPLVDSKTYMIPSTIRCYEAQMKIVAQTTPSPRRPQQKKNDN